MEKIIIEQAIMKAYCKESNIKKPIDADLICDMADEVMKLLPSFRQLEDIQEFTNRLGVVGMVDSMAWRNDIQKRIPLDIMELVAIDFYLHIDRHLGMTDSPKEFREWWDKNIDRFMDKDGIMSFK